MLVTFLQQELALYEDEARVNRQVCISAVFELMFCTIMLIKCVCTLVKVLCLLYIS